MTADEEPSSQSVKPFSISLNKNKSSTASARVIPKKRPHSHFSDDEQGHQNDGKSHLISSFNQSAGGVVPNRESEAPIIIKPQPNRNWRHARRGKNLLPEEEQARRAGAQDVKEEKKQSSYGLIRPERAKKGQEDDIRMPDAGKERRAEHRLTENDEALDALLGKERQSTLVIEASPAQRVSEAESFREDLDSRPDGTLDQYEAVSIAEFGAALLRGMGWEEGQTVGRRKTGTVKTRAPPEQRPGLLGIGAKEVPEGLEEMGAWGKGAKKSKKIDRSYNPLVLRNSRTGETLTEEELKARQEQNRIVGEDFGGSQDRQTAGHDKESSRRHWDRGSDRDYERSRHDSSRRRRSRSPRHRDNGRKRDRESHWRRDREYDEESDYERRRKEKRIEREYDNESNSEKRRRAKRKEREYGDEGDYEGRRKEKRKDRSDVSDRHRSSRYDDDREGGRYGRERDDYNDRKVDLPGGRRKERV